MATPPDPTDIGSVRFATAFYLSVHGRTPFRQDDHHLLRIAMSDLPIACTLSVGELRDPDADLLPALAPLASAIRVGRDAVELEFVAGSAILDRLTRVINRERTCCAFLQFTLLVPPGGGAFRFNVDGPAGTGALLASLHPAFASPAP